MISSLLVSDLHGLTSRYDKLFKLIEDEKPQAVFIAGDILPSGMFLRYQISEIEGDFVDDFLAGNLEKLRTIMRADYPEIFLILGNDDPRSEEARFIEYDQTKLWHYMHNRKYAFGNYAIYGYACVPPTPFLLKDWERYDVSRFVDVGSVSPEEGSRTIEVPNNKIRYRTIKDDLDQLVGDDDLSDAVFLFHTPPNKTNLDRGDLEGMMLDYVPLDQNLGSIAVRRFITARQPLLTLHGHIHESSRLTGSWQDKLGRTFMFNAAIESDDLSVIRFDLENLESAEREII